MQGEVRGLPLFYSYIRLMREGKREGWKKEREREGGEGNGGEAGEEKGISERGETTKGKEGKRCKERVRKYIYEILSVRQMSIVAIWTVASPCCAILCWRQMNHPC